MTRIGSLLLAAVASAGLASPTTAQAQQAEMSFFITSVGKGNGADLGGLAGADAHCQALATAAGAASPNWRAYLSTTEPGGNAGVNARDRIGKGPWKNAKGVVVATNVEDLHSASANINKQTALTEKGEARQRPRRPGQRARHPDRLGPARPYTRRPAATPPAATGPRAATARPSSAITTVPVSKDTRHMNSWNSSHGSRGCSQDQLKASGGAGMIYCFRTN